MKTKELLSHNKMKNLIITLVLLVTFNVSFSQEKEQDQITNTERIVDKYGDKIVTGFEDLITKVTPMAEDAFEIVVRLEIAKGIGYSLGSFFCLILITILVSILVKNKEDPDAVFFLMLGIVGCSVCFCIITYHALLRLIAPEWFAIKEILNLIN